MEDPLASPQRSLHIFSTRSVGNTAFKKQSGQGFLVGLGRDVGLGFFVAGGAGVEEVGTVGVEEYVEILVGMGVTLALVTCMDAVA